MTRKEFILNGRIFNGNEINNFEIYHHFPNTPKCCGCGNKIKDNTDYFKIRSDDGDAYNLCPNCYEELKKEYDE